MMAFSFSPQSPVPGMNSSIVPGRSRIARASAISSSRLACARGHRVAVAVVVRRRRARTRSRARPRAPTGAAARPSRASSSGVASWPTARSPITTRRSAEWPTRKPAFTASLPSSRPRYSPKLRQSQGTPVCEALERHALDAREHAHQVVARPGRERRDREAAVAADHGRDAVERARRERRVPEGLRVVVGVDVDEAGRDDEARGVDRLRAPARRRGRARRCARRGSRRRRARPGAPVPSTSVPPRMSRSSMAILPGSKSRSVPRPRGPPAGRRGSPWFLTEWFIQ